MKKKSTKYTVKNNFGERRTWQLNPTQRIHNEEGKKYSRKNYKVEKEE